MMGLYGKYIENHGLFSSTHKDFIRQLVVHLKRCIYFPGNVISEKGDVDGSMFIVHRGEVEHLEVVGRNYVRTAILSAGNFIYPEKKTFCFFVLSCL